MNDMAQRAALYARVSTEEQAKHGLSLEEQKRVLRQYAADNRMKIVGEFIDEGISARKRYNKRPDFVKMLATVEADEIDVILFVKLDRWFRNIADYYEVQKILDAHKVQWIATEEEYNTTTASGRLYLNIKLSIAQDEADRTSERIKFVFEGKKARGELCSGSVPYGFKIVDKKLEIVPAEAEIVKGAFDEYIAQRSITKVVEYLQQFGKIITWRGAGFLLANERYRGVIIDENTFDIAQEIRATRAQRRSKTGRVYIFGGLVKCSECGVLMMSCFSRGLKYYRCRKHVTDRICSNSRSVSQNTLEKWLLLHLEEECAKYNVEMKSAAKKAKKINPQAIQKKKDKLTDLYLNDLITREKYEAEFRAVEDAMREVSTEAKEIDLSHIRTVTEAYNGLDDQGKKAFWSRITKEIIAYPDGSFNFIPRCI